MSAVFRCGSVISKGFVRLFAGQGLFALAFRIALAHYTILNLSPFFAFNEAGPNFKFPRFFWHSKNTAQALPVLGSWR